jgi:hypothetical protein
MLRTRLRNCQGALYSAKGWRPSFEPPMSSRSRFNGELARLHAQKHKCPHCSKAGFTVRCRRAGSPIFISTRVPLTRTWPKSILCGIGHCPTYQGRRKLIETMGRESVYRFETGS